MENMHMSKMLKKLIGREKNIASKYLRYLESLSNHTRYKNSDIMSNHLITKGVIARMYYFYKTQKEYCENIGRGLKYSGCDYFEDTVASYLRSILSNIFQVKIEESSVIRNKNSKKQYRPDIEVFYKGKRIFVLELKTQLGWNRKNWKSDIKQRQKDICKAFNLPMRRVVTVVMTADNWAKGQEIPADMIILSKLWPGPDNKIEDLMQDVNYVSFLEPLFKEIKKYGA